MADPAKKVLLAAKARGAETPLVKPSETASPGLSPAARHTPVRVAGVLSAAYLTFAALQPEGGWLPFPVCGFRALSGLPCPGCGLTRSLTALLHLDFGAAWSWNPLGFAALPVLLTAILLAASPSPWIRRAESALGSARASRMVLASTAAILVAGGVRAALVAAGYCGFPA